MFVQSSVRLLLDRYWLNRLRQTIDCEVDNFIVDVEDDPERSSLIDDPFISMKDVRDRLEQLEARLLEQSDRRAVFLTLYTEITAETIREIDAGEFIESA